MTTLFISHSWPDKTIADKLAGDLKGVATVWLDSQQTKPGIDIGDSVHAGLDECEIAIVIWSQNAAASAWVEKEATYALENGKNVVPILLDATPLTGSLAGLLGIPARDWQDDYAKCFMRLNLAIAKLQSQALAASGVNLNADELFAHFDDVDGVVNYISDYREENNISGDAGHWIDRVLTATNAAQSKGKAYMAKLQEGVAYSQSLTDRISGALQDPVKLRAIRDEIAANQDRSPIMGQMLTMVEQMLGTFPTDANDEPAEQRAESLPGRRIREQVRTAIEVEERTQQLAVHLSQVFTQKGVAVTPQTLAEARGHVINYIQHVPDLVDELAANAASHGLTDQVEPLLNGVTAYFEDPDDLVPDALGLIGLVDDAYLAYNALRQANQLAVAQVGQELVVDNLQAVNQVIELLLGPELVSQLQLRAQSELGRQDETSPWWNVGKAVLGGLVAYGAYRIIANAAEQETANTQAASSSWGNTFEDQVSQFMAESGYSTPDW